MYSGAPGLHILLDLNGESFSIDPRGDYTVRFIVREIPRSPERPHGLSYSLTLHDKTGARIVGFDNAHATPTRTGHGRPSAHDHRHRLGMTRHYEYRDAMTLPADFWAEVEAVLKERGVLA
jgi:hypothetical protein